MRLLLLLLFLTCFQLRAAAQSNEFPENLTNIRDTAGINRLLRYTDSLVKRGDETGASYAAKALALSEELNYDYGIGMSKVHLGITEMHKSHYPQADAYYKQGIRYFTRLHKDNELAQTYTMTGINAGMQNNSADALEWFLKALKIREDLKDEAGMADTYYKIGLVYGQIEEFDKALDYQNKSLRYAVKTDNKQLMMGIYNNIGMLNGKKGEMNKALESLIKSRDLSISLHNLKYQADLYLNIGSVYLEMKRYDSSETYLRTAIDLYSTVGFKLGETASRTAMAHLFARQKKYDSARAYLFKNINAARSFGDDNLLFDNYGVLVDVYKGQGNYKAASDIFDSLMVLKDNINNAERAELVERVQMNHDIRKKEEAITGLQTDNKLKTTQRNILLIISIVVVILIIVTAVSLISLRKKKLMLEERERNLAELNKVKDKLFSVISHDLRGPVTSILAVLELLQNISIPETERQDMFRELHVSTSATLATLDNLLIWGSSQLQVVSVVPEPVPVKEIAERTIELYNSGASRKSLTIHNKVQENCISMFDRNQLEYILRNLVANAIKFSFPGQEIWINGSNGGDRVILEVKDQGMGMTDAVRNALFDPLNKKTAKGTEGESGVGLGLTLIMDFLGKNGGRITVSSEPGKGASFSLDIPSGNTEGVRSN